MIIEQINKPNDIKKIPKEDWGTLAEEIRAFLVSYVASNGGHLSSNLGVVELTMALHLTFVLPRDRIIWDVGHQAYTHKLLTGRRDQFKTLRQYGGLSGFPKRRESASDAFDTGHSSTSISAALGMAKARDLKHEKRHIVAVIGDGAMTGGMAFEALNNLADLKSNLIIILNDNTLSISPNVGGMKSVLDKLRTSNRYTDLKESITTRLSRVPGGENITRMIRSVKDGMKQFVVPSGMMFEDMGITYIGPFDGHQIPQMLKGLSMAKRVKGPVLMHVITQKGRGYEPAEKDPSRFHGIGEFDVETGKPKIYLSEKSFTEYFSEAMVELGEASPEVVAVSAAMKLGTGLASFAEKYPDRFFDVGIAEQHAVTFAAGMATLGMRPVVAIYSSFLQRAYDQILHDVCLQNLPVVFCIDRAGFVGQDGETHQGLFDLSYLGHLPGMTILSPKNGEELKKMLAFAVQMNGPVAIRYKRGGAGRLTTQEVALLQYGKAVEILHADEPKVMLLSDGLSLSTAMGTCQRIREKGIACSVWHMRFIKPLDVELLKKAVNCPLIVTLEEGMASGGMGERILAELEKMDYKGHVEIVAVEDEFVEQGPPELLRRVERMDENNICIRLARRLADLKEQQ